MATWCAYMEDGWRVHYVEATHAVVRLTPEARHWTVVLASDTPGAATPAWCLLHAIVVAEARTAALRQATEAT
jgi:hypothetical protein